MYNILPYGLFPVTDMHTHLSRLKSDLIMFLVRKDVQCSETYARTIIMIFLTFFRSKFFFDETFTFAPICWWLDQNVFQKILEIYFFQNSLEKMSMNFFRIFFSNK